MAGALLMAACDPIESELAVTNGCDHSILVHVTYLPKSAVGGYVNTEVYREGATTLALGQVFHDQTIRDEGAFQIVTFGSEEAVVEWVEFEKGAGIPTHVISDGACDI